MIKLQVVAHIAESYHPRTTADLLAGTLGKGRRIGEALMVEDVIETDSCSTHIETIEGQFFEQALLNPFSQIHLTQHVVVAGVVIIDVRTYLCTVDTGINALPS